MSRALIKSLKRTLRQGTHAQASETQALDARAAALSLLQRSVKMRHDRLAILRLVDAVRLDARVDEAQWDYCQTVASSMADPAQLRMLQTLRRYVAHHAVGIGSGPGPPGGPVRAPSAGRPTGKDHLNRTTGDKNENFFQQRLLEKNAEIAKLRCGGGGADFNRDKRAGMVAD